MTLFEDPLLRPGRPRGSSLFRHKFCPGGLRVAKGTGRGITASLQCEIAEGDATDWKVAAPSAMKSKSVARLSRSRCPLLYWMRPQPHRIVEGSADDVSRQLAFVSLDLDLRAERGELRRQMS